MVRYLYQTQVLTVGEFVKDYLQEKKMILFAEPVPEDIAFYCAVHRPSLNLPALFPGQRLKINDRDYLITAVGAVANNNLQSLGHITLSFDGAEQAELPGTVHLQGEAPRIIAAGDNIAVYEI